MCVAITVPEGVEVPSLETLRDCERANQCGAGIAWVRRKKVHWVKGLDAKEVYYTVKNLSGPRLIHFRLATVAGPTKPLCHPFAIDKRANPSPKGKANRVLMHNGHWWGWEDYMDKNFPGYTTIGGPWSDTRALAYLFHIFGDIVGQNLDEKIATLSADGEIKHFGSWTEHDGCQFSNLNWQYSYTSMYNGSCEWGEDYDPYDKVFSSWDEYVRAHEKRAAIAAFFKEENEALRGRARKDYMKEYMKSYSSEEPRESSSSLIAVVKK